MHSETQWRQERNISKSSAGRKLHWKICLRLRLWVNLAFPQHQQHGTCRVAKHPPCCCLTAPPKQKKLILNCVASYCSTLKYLPLERFISCSDRFLLIPWSTLPPPPHSPTVQSLKVPHDALCAFPPQQNIDRWSLQCDVIYYTGLPLCCKQLTV